MGLSKGTCSTVGKQETSDSPKLSQELRTWLRFTFEISHASNLILFHVLFNCNLQNESYIMIVGVVSLKVASLMKGINYLFDSG